MEYGVICNDGCNSTPLKAICDEMKENSIYQVGLRRFTNIHLSYVYVSFHVFNL